MSSIPQKIEGFYAKNCVISEYLYYVLDQPEVTDAEFDAMPRELRALEDQRPELITEDSHPPIGGQAPGRIRQGSTLKPDAESG